MNLRGDPPEEEEPSKFKPSLGRRAFRTE